MFDYDLKTYIDEIYTVIA